MNHISKLLVVVLGLGLTVSLSACNGAPTPNIQPESTSAKPTTTKDDDVSQAIHEKSSVHLEYVLMRGQEKLVQSSVDLLTAASLSDYKATSIATSNGSVLETRVIDSKCYTRPLTQGIGFSIVPSNKCPLDLNIFRFDSLTSELAALKKSGLESHGSETIDGIKTVAYRLGNSTDGSSSTLWIGEDNLPRKAEISFTDNRTVTILYTKWGQGEAIEAPKPSEMSD